MLRQRPIQQHSPSRNKLNFSRPATSHPITPRTHASGRSPARKSKEARALLRPARHLRPRHPHHRRLAESLRLRHLRLPHQGRVLRLRSLWPHQVPHPGTEPKDGRHLLSVVRRDRQRLPRRRPQTVRPAPLHRRPQPRLLDRRHGHAQVRRHPLRQDRPRRVHPPHGLRLVHPLRPRSGLRRAQRTLQNRPLAQMGPISACPLPIGLPKNLCIRVP
jgi:hypothetical protein